MNDQSYQHLKELSWRQPLTPAQKERLRDYLSAHAELREDWEREAHLNQLLRELLPVPVSSNFTARVLQAAQRVPLKKVGWLERTMGSFGLVSRWLPRYVAPALVVSCITLVSIHQYQVQQHKKIAKDLVKVSQVASLPDMEWLKDFETIDRLSRAQVSDGELLTAFR